MALSSKMERFCTAIAAGETQRQAAVLAGYTAKDAASRASKLLRRPDVKREIERAKSGQLVPSRDPLQFLLDVAQGLIDPTNTQLKAAIAAAQYLHPRPRTGKKGQQHAAAGTAAAGRFAPARGPGTVTPIRPRVPGDAA